MAEKSLSRRIEALMPGAMRKALQGVLRHSQVWNFYQWWKRRHLPEPGRIMLSQRRVYILPTRHGLTFGLALILMLIGSINYSLSLGYVLTFLLAGMAIVSILHTFRNLVQLVVAAGRVDPVFAGDTAHFEIHLENGRAEPRVAIDANTGGAVVSADIPGRGAACLSIPVPAPRRGRLDLPRVTLETRFPLGLIRAWSYVQPTMQTLVYPRPDESGLPPPRPIEGMGSASTTGIGNEDFASLREYQPSDSPRHIAWKAAARGDTMLTKQFSGRASEERLFDWEHLPVKLGTEERLSRLARWALLAHAGGARFALHLPGVEVPLGAGEAHLALCLEKLALFEGGARAAGTA